MGALKGQAEYQKYLDGESLTMKQAIKAMCFVCNGEEEGRSEDCQGNSCPLYAFFKKWMLRPGCTTEKPENTEILSDDSESKA